MRYDSISYDTLFFVDCIIINALVIWLSSCIVNINILFLRVEYLCLLFCIIYTNGSLPCVQRCAVGSAFGRVHCAGRRGGGEPPGDGPAGCALCCGANGGKTQVVSKF